MDIQSLQGVADDAAGVVSDAKNEPISAAGELSACALDAPAFDRAAETAHWTTATSEELVAALDELRETGDKQRYDVVGKVLWARLRPRYRSQLKTAHRQHRAEEALDSVLDAICDPFSRHHAGFLEDFEEASLRRDDGARVAVDKRHRRFRQEDPQAERRTDVLSAPKGLCQKLADWRDVERIDDLVTLAQTLERLPSDHATMVVLRLQALKLSEIAARTGENIKDVQIALADFTEMMTHRARAGNRGACFTTVQKQVQQDAGD